MMTAESMLSKRPVLGITMALSSFLNNLIYYAITSANLEKACWLEDIAKTSVLFEHSLVHFHVPIMRLMVESNYKQIKKLMFFSLHNIITMAASSKHFFAFLNHFKIA